VAEAYISLTSNRHYRDPWDGKAALNEIGKYVRSGKFDPMIVDTLADIISELD
jgi:HD-GYP domain-containing protein (c-di-GMP phosphodiesterase class II)